MKPDQVSLYKKLLSAANSLPQYNYRCYFVDKVKYMFRKQNYEQLDNPSFIEHCNSLLTTLKRQSNIQKSLSPESLIIE